MKLLILGTGGMAAAHARAFGSMPGVKVAAACDVDAGRAKSFAAAHHIPKSYGSLEAALEAGGFDAVTNVTPDPIHHPTTLKCLAAGKHVLCEKPLAESHALAQEMTDAATKAGLVNMVNLSYRNVPALQKARELIAEGKVGEVRHLEASYRQSWLVANNWGEWNTDPKWLWRLSSKHGSRGVLGDVGIHILDFATFATGLKPTSLQARLKTFDKAPDGKIGDYVLDANDSAAMSLEFNNGAIGVIHTSRFMPGYANTLKLHVFGTKGGLEIDHNPGWTRLRLCAGEDVHNQAWADVECPPVKTNFQKFAEAVASGKNGEPDFAHATELQRYLDACFEVDACRAVAI
jgi:predicted dehydrogenase